MNERIRLIRTTLGLTQKQFAAELGLTQGSISYLEKKGSKITTQNFHAVCTQFGVSEQWLASGEGDMFLIMHKPDRKRHELLEIYASLTPEFQDFLARTAQDLLSLQTGLSNLSDSDTDAAADPASGSFSRMLRPTAESATYHSFTDHPFSVPQQSGSDADRSFPTQRKKNRRT